MCTSIVHLCRCEFNRFVLKNKYALHGKYSRLKKRRRNDSASVLYSVLPGVTLQPTGKSDLGFPCEVTNEQKLGKMESILVPK